MKKALLAAAALLLGATPALGAGKVFHVSGQGIIEEGRQFTLSATVTPNGTVNGHATLIIPDDSGPPYIAQIDISCVNQVDGEIYLGGSVTYTNEPDPVYSDAVFFAVSSGGDQLSRAYFWDFDPAITGDPGACSGNQAGDFALEDVIRGNITVH
jgi:hypothetical protein